MQKRIGIAAAACFAFALCFALVGCGGVNKEAYTGTWVLESASDENLSTDAIELMKGLGLDVEMTLNEDGTGTMNLFGESMELSWDAKSNTDGTVSFDGNDATLKLADGKLTLEDATGSSMLFVPYTADEAASSGSASGEAASGDAAASGEAASGDAAASGEAAGSADAADAGADVEKSGEAGE